MSVRNMWIWISLIIVVYFVMAIWITVPSSTVSWPAGTSYSNTKTGTSALYTLFHSKPAAGSERVRVEPQTGLIQTPSLLIVEPTTDVQAQTVQTILALAARGLRVVLLSDRQTALASALHIHLASPFSDPGAHGTLQILSPDRRNTKAKTAGGRYSFTYHGTVSTLAGWRKGDTLISAGFPQGANRVVGVTRAIGKGAVTILSIPTLFYNGEIGHGNQLGLLIALLHPQTDQVGFLETVHGYAITPGALAILGPGATTGFIVLCLAVACLLWAEGRRFGHPQTAFVSAPPASLEYAQALARHYKNKRSLDGLRMEVDQLYLDRFGALPPIGQEIKSGQEAKLDHSVRAYESIYLRSEKKNGTLAKSSAADRPRTREGH